MQLSQSAQRLQRFLNPFLLLSLGLWLLCLVVTAAKQHTSDVAKFYWPFYRPYFQWWDFRVYVPRFALLHTTHFFSADRSLTPPFEYPAPMAVLYSIFYKLGGHSLSFFLCSTIAAVVLLAAMLVVELTRRNVPPVRASLAIAATLLLSYPFAIEYKLGNMEVCVFIINTFALISWLRERPFLAALLIGLSASLKIFPLIFIGLFVARKQYWAAATSILTVAAINLLSLWYVGPSFSVAAKGISAGLAENQAHYMRTFLPLETGFDHSILGFIKMALYAVHVSKISVSFLHAYLLSVAVSGLFLYFWRVRKLPILNQVLFLCIASIWLTPTSHDYTLLHLFLPWGLFVLYTTEASQGALQDQRLTWVFLLFAVLFSAEYEVGYKSIYMGGQVKCIALAVFAVLALRWRFHWPALDGIDRIAPALSVS